MGTDSTTKLPEDWLRRFVMSQREVENYRAACEALLIADVEVGKAALFAAEAQKALMRASAEQDAASSRRNRTAEALLKAVEGES